MANRSPPSVPRRWLAAIAVLLALAFGYAVVVRGQVLFVAVPAFAVVSLYLVWRFLVAFEAIADAQQRIADRQERE